MGGEIAVLVVDEDEDMLELTETFLTRESDQLSVTTEKRPPAAAEQAKNGTFDCIVSDLRMPEMDGIELCETVRESRPGIPFFLFTAADLEDVRSDSDEELTGVIQKGTGTDHYKDLADQIVESVS